MDIESMRGKGRKYKYEMFANEQVILSWMAPGPGSALILEAISETNHAYVGVSIDDAKAMRDWLSARIAEMEG